jgi:hypothetical protein
MGSLSLPFFQDTPTSAFPQRQLLGTSQFMMPARGESVQPPDINMEIWLWINSYT